MLYLPPGWGHDGTAVGACLTASIGFRAPLAGTLAADVLQRLGDAAASDDDPPARLRRRYRDPGEAASDRPARVPAGLQRFAVDAVGRLADDRAACARALGESLSEPKPGTWFERREKLPVLPVAVVLDRKTRMLYDERHVFINGESFRAAGRDATLARRLADRRRLDARSVAGMSAEAGQRLAEWLRAGWCAGADEPVDEDDDMTDDDHHRDRIARRFPRCRSRRIRAAEERDAAEIFIVDPTFADWPLNEPALIESLGRWIDSRKTLTVFAHDFSELARHQLRFVAWRRQWSHVVRCRSDPELEAEQLPTLMLVPGVTSVRLLDRVRQRGHRLASRDRSGRGPRNG